LDEFASLVSHDLRNPLNVAEARLELARQDCSSDHLDVVVRAHDRMRTLIEDMLLLARDGARVTDVEPVALGGIVRECSETVDTAEATLVAETERTVQADATRLQQLLENPIRNAIEYGGMGVTVTVGDLDGGFYVADDGPGVPEAERESVFSTGYSMSDDGHGLGLAIVQAIAEAHGWHVTLTESEDGGARFEITGVEISEHSSGRPNELDEG
jgi:signal transduction histidine kinase